MVSENKHKDSVMAGMELDSIGCLGCTVSFSARMKRLVTWREVLDGRRIGIQIWRKGGRFRNVNVSYKGRSKTEQGIVNMTNILYDEVYGDRIHAFHLLDYHQCYINIQLNKAIAKLKAKKDKEYLASDHLRQLQASYLSLLDLVDNW